MVYLDYCANTPADKEVLNLFYAIESDYIGNANAHYQSGQKTAELIRKAQEKIAEDLQVGIEEIIFTSGASEANNLAIKGYCQARRHFGRHIITNVLEHPSVSGPLTFLKQNGFEVDMVRIRNDGCIDLDHLRSLLRDDTILVTLCAIDSELGTIQPIRETKEIISDYKECRLLVDGTQAIGKIKPDLSAADLFSCSAHKFYGLNGSGLLVKKKDVSLEPLIHGGNSTSIYRSGSPTAALDCCLQQALSTAIEKQSEWNNIVSGYNKQLRAFFESYPKVRINSPADGVPSILNLSVDGIRGNEMQRLLDEEGICVSVKTACSVEGLPSRSVLAISNDRQRALSSFRISLSHLTTEEELNYFKEKFDRLYQERICTSMNS